MQQSIEYWIDESVKIGKKACWSDLFKLSCKNFHKKADYILNVLYKKFISWKIQMRKIPFL